MERKEAKLLSIGGADGAQAALGIPHRAGEPTKKERRSGAVAIVNRLTVVTRNVGDFNQLGVPVLDQFGDLR